jgi:hypothetical protein
MCFDDISNKNHNGRECYKAFLLNELFVEQNINISEVDTYT